ncbi:MAG: methyl-accepting chemotaxis protein [Bdellovibrionia bacterium]
MLNRLSLAGRLLMSNVVYSIPVIILSYIVVTAKNEPINFNKWEWMGDQYQRPLQTLLEGVSKHKLLAQRALHGDTKSKAMLGDVQAQIDKGLVDLKAIDAQLGVDLQFTDEGLAKRKREHFRASTFEKEWTDLKGRIEGLKPQESNDLHTHLIADVRTMIVHMGDTSNLILDPDLDSYYLMDVTLLALPQTQDRLQDVIANVEPLLRTGRISAQDRITLEVYSAMMKQADLDRIVGSIQTSLNEDPNFQGKNETFQAEAPVLLAAFQKEFEKFIAMTKRIAAEPTLTVNADEYVAQGEAVLGLAHSYSRFALTEMDKLVMTRINAYEKSKYSALGFAAVGLLFVSLFFLYISNGLTKSISAAVGRMREAADKGAESSNKLVNASSKVSSASTEQASAIQETVATLNQINAMVGKSVDNAGKAAKVSGASRDVATKGKRAVGEMITAIDEITASNAHIMKQIDESTSRITEIVKVITEIANKTKVINDIVFQTKLLSFNASVEAARAGEHGKGFAVVAEEVGNLAQMSGNAAKEIGEMLSSSILRVQSIVTDTKSQVEKLVQVGKSKVEAGLVTAKRCEEVLEEVVGNVNQANSMISEISVASKEQAQGINEISRAMGQLDEATQLNADTSHETANQAEQLLNQATTLREIVFSMEREILGRRNIGEPAKTGSPSPTPSNVIPLNNHRPAKAQAPQQSQVKAVSGSDVVPDQDDSRFKEI